MFRGLLDLILPSRCPLCPAVPQPGEAFCPTCVAALFDDDSLACPACAATVGPFAVIGGQCAWCRDEHFAFTGAIRMGTYTGKRRELVLRLKSASAEWLADLTIQHWIARRSGHLRIFTPTAVVPIPMHWRRRLWRQTNHACTLAHSLAVGLGLPYRPWWLWRIRATPEQKGLTRSARRDNLKGAFMARGMPAGERVLLVDDVMTSGSTAHEAARTLLAAGAASVHVTVLARVAEEAGGVVDAGLP